MDISKAEIYKLLADEKLVGEVISKAVDDPDVVDDLASDVADEISDILEDDPQYQQKIIKAATKSPTFKKRIIKEVVGELGD